jgi:hypothetical protein
MTPQERDLITALLTRLQRQGDQAKDPEADALIRQAMAAQADAPYLLVQTVLIQDMALHEAQNRIAEMERRAGEQPQPQAAPSFLPQRATQSQSQDSAPNAGPWGAAPAEPAPPPRRDSVWSQSYAPPQQAAPPPPAYGYPPAPGYGGGPGYGPQMLAGGGGGFLRQAAATAAGVVGGSLLFQGIHSMFGGSGFLGGTPMQPGLSETVVNNYYNDPATNDPNTADDSGQNNDQGVTQADYTDNQDDADSDQDFGGQDYGNDSGSSDV